MQINNRIQYVSTTDASEETETEEQTMIEPIQEHTKMLIDFKTLGTHGSRN